MSPPTLFGSFMIVVVTIVCLILTITAIVSLGLLTIESLSLPLLVCLELVVLVVLGTTIVQDIRLNLYWDKKQ